jgi:hypothetical protein
VPYGVLVIAVVLIAVGGFVGAEWLEVKFGGAERSAQPLLGAVGLGGSRRLMLGFAALGLTAALAGSPYVGSTATFNTDELTLDVVRANDHMTPEQLADRLIAAVDVPRIVDLRDPAAFARTHLPGATNVPMAGLGREPWRVDETVLLYSGADPHAEQAWMLLKARKFPPRVHAAGRHRRVERAGALPPNRRGRLRRSPAEDRRCPCLRWHAPHRGCSTGSARSGANASRPSSGSLARGWRQRSQEEEEALLPIEWAVLRL